MLEIIHSELVVKMSLGKDCRSDEMKKAVETCFWCVEIKCCFESWVQK